MNPSERGKNAKTLVNFVNPARSFYYWLSFFVHLGVLAWEFKYLGSLVFSSYFLPDHPKSPDFDGIFDFVPLIGVQMTMVNTVTLSRRAMKDLKSLPRHIVDKLET